LLRITPCTVPTYSGMTMDHPVRTVEHPVHAMELLRITLYIRWNALYMLWSCYGPPCTFGGAPCTCHGSSPQATSPASIQKILFKRSKTPLSAEHAMYPYTYIGIYPKTPQPAEHDINPHVYISIYPKAPLTASAGYTTLSCISQHILYPRHILPPPSSQTAIHSPHDVYSYAYISIYSKISLEASVGYTIP
jgi:hypothetical protein